MKVYLDILIIINFICDFLILLSINILLKNKTSIIRIILASLIGEITLICLFLPLSNISLILIKVLTSILMIIIAFKYKNYNYFKKNIIYFYLLSIVMGGITYFIKLILKTNTNDLVFNTIILLIISPYLFYKYIKTNINYKNNINLYHNIDIYIDNKKYSYKGFIDTGNTIKDQYKKRSIIFISDNKIKFNYKNSILVPYKTISENNLIKCRKVDKVIIDSKEIIKNILVAKTNKKINEDYDCILPNSFIIYN